MNARGDAGRQAKSSARNPAFYSPSNRCLGVALPAAKFPPRDFLALAHHEGATGGAAAADIEHRETLGALDLVIARRPAHLAVAIEHLAHAGRAHRMAYADEAAAGIHRHPAAHLDSALFDRLPRLARLGDAEVIDRHV